MSPPTIEYAIPATVEHRALAEAIAAQHLCSENPPLRLSRRIYDTFDWRLFAADLGLEWASTVASGAATDAPVGAFNGIGMGSSRQTAPPASASPQGSAPAQLLCLHSLRDPAAPIRQPFAPEPGFLSELPNGVVRERLEGLLDIRRLLPMAELISTQIRLRLLNEDGKTVVSVVIESNRVRCPAAGGEADLSARLRLKAVRGYRHAFALAERWLQEQFALEPADQHQLLEALRGAGQHPGGYSSKLDYRLDPGERADSAAKAIHRGLLRTLEANIEGTRANLDSEFLHDLRVATRRTRSALSQIKDVFPAEEVADFKERFAWLQQVTGPTRDLDVYLLDFPELERRLPPSLGADLKPLQELLAGQYETVQADLARALGSRRFRELLRDWRGFLDAPLPSAPGGQPPSEDRPARPKRALQPIKRVADQRIRKMLARVRAEGSAITDASPPEELHELRKSCKKLRYLMEFCQSLYEPARIREQIKQTKVLLDNLGRFQDTAVQAQHLRDTAESAGCLEGGLPPVTLLAMGALIGQLIDEQRRARAAFSAVFDGFNSDANAARFDALLGESKAPQPSAKAD